ncbi:MAG TPA: SDR family NAD(P)-dependent oxidoreductase [Azospirillaceae bacterium]|nr:SDR family NAD(P)-dependent oxidoreductase [Azospirillaceae bacterium]
MTGAASGLGREVALALARAGWRLAALDLNADGLAKVAGELSAAGASKVHTGTVDVRDAEAMAVAYAQAAEALGGLDLVVNNAGVAVGGRFLETPVEDWRWVLDINLLGMVNGCRAALPLLLAGGGGHVVNVASAAAFGTMPGMAAYNASKAAALSLTETLHCEYLDDDRLSFSCVMPVFFKTGLGDAMRAPPAERTAGRLLMDNADFTAADAARFLLEGVAAKEFYVFCPPRVRGFWRFKRFLPMAFMRKVPAMRQKRLEALMAAGKAPT